MKIKQQIYSMFFLLLLFFPCIYIPVYAADGATVALDKSKHASTSTTCVCSDSITGMDGKTYSKTSANEKYCVYGEIKKACNSLDTSTAIKKFQDAGIKIDPAFSSNAGMYKGYVMDNLTQKTQYFDGNWKTKDLGNNAMVSAMDQFNDNAHWVYSFLMGIGLITAFLVFAINFVRLSWLPSNPMQRRRAIEDILKSGVSVFLLGGIWIFISLFQSMFDDFWITNAVYSKDWKTVGNMVLYEYRGFIVGFTGIATITMIIMFIKNLVGLSIKGANPVIRTQQIISILFCGIAAAGLGGITIFVGFFWNALK